MADDIAARLARLEDIEAIRRLKHLYCRLCDEDYQPDPLVALFTEDGVWDAGEAYGRFEGHEAMRGFFRSMPAVAAFSAHTVLNEEIDLDGDVARGRWRAVIPASFYIEGKPVPHWIISRYDDRFRRENGVWKFTLCRSIIQKSGPHDGGWE